MKNKIVRIFEESIEVKKKFIEGHKTAIISNIDKIMSLVTARYHSMDIRVSDNVIQNSKDLMLRVMYATTFDDIARLEPVFKTGVTLPVYELFMNSMKRSKLV